MTAAIIILCAISLITLFWSIRFNIRSSKDIQANKKFLRQKKKEWSELELMMKENNANYFIKGTGNTVESFIPHKKPF